MKRQAPQRPGFLQGVMVALLFSLAGGALFVSTTALFATDLALRAVIALLGLAYVLYLLSRSRARTGRVTALTVWALVAGTAWFVTMPLPLFVAVHVGLVWLLRSLYFHASVLAACADLGLSVLALAAAFWATTQSHSFALALWCFFLVQALFVAIPARLWEAGTPAGRQPTGERFERAHRSAEAALRRLHARS